MSKNIFQKFIIVFVFSQISNATVYGQTMDQEFVFKGKVKKMTVEKPSDSDDHKMLITVREFDKKGRRIKEISPYSTQQEFYYSDQRNSKPILTVNSDRQSSKLGTASIEERNIDGKTESSGDLNNDLWQYYYLHEYTPKMHTVKWFVNNEIDFRTTEESMDLSKFSIPSRFVTFDWDKNLSNGIIKKSYSYSNSRFEHSLTFEFYEKDQPENKIIFTYNGYDVYDAGKGYWSRFEDGKEVEERYIYSASEISDFGHRLRYNPKGLLISDLYGYFAKMPSEFMQRKVFTYNQNGDCIAETSDAENAATDIVKYEYTYDQQNNWITRKSIFSDNSGTTIKRKFVYYQENEADLENGLSEEIYQQFLKKLRDHRQVAIKQFDKYSAEKSKKDKAVIPKIDFKELRSKRWQDFLPAQQKLDTIATGDLNKDGLEDVVIVFEAQKLLKSERNEIRTLRILLQQTDGNYKLAAESKGAVAGENMSNVYFGGVQIEKGIMIIDHGFIRGGCTHRYRWQNGGMFLIGVEKNTGDASYYSSTDYNLSTGKYIEEYQNEEENEDLPRSYKRIKTQKLQNLPNIESYELFSLKVGEDNL